MAGIAGFFGEPDPGSAVSAMLATIQHRGPDTVRRPRRGRLCAGVYSSDLSEARGDGFAVRGSLAVLLDGEVYNERPPGKSDADVVLELYGRFGRAFPAHLQGAFACAVSDGTELVLARDSLGVRPLYWAEGSDGSIWFASEMICLVDKPPNVMELPPASTLSSRSGVAGYLPCHPEVCLPSSFDEAARELRARLTRAVARRLEDGAVGACLLSGGLDSSVIAALIHALGGHVPLITVGTDGAPDLRYAAMMAEHLGMEHRVFLYGRKEAAELVPQAVLAIESYDEDCVSGAIANLFASQKASQFTNCILSGEGGDELFGGYHLLKELPTDAARLRMMERLIRVAHNTALQRLDRAMMANSIEYRTPFLDTEVAALAAQLPVRWKIHDAGDGRLIEKHILREAFRDLLPEEVYRREKVRFSGGTGTDSLMDELAEREFDAAQAGGDARATDEGLPLNSLKELWYYRIFRDYFPGGRFERLVGRWDPNKPGAGEAQ